MKNILKALFAALLVVLAAASLFSCGKHEHDFTQMYSDAEGHALKCECGEKEALTPHISSGYATTESAEYCVECGYEISPEILKVIFIGNSHVYFGCTVNEKTQSVKGQEARTNDRGYFFQLCMSNGLAVEVTNWTFGGHKLHDIFRFPCTADRGCDGVDHESYLVNRDFDYVVVSSGVGKNSEEKFVEDFEYIMEFFKAANPDVKFVCLGNASVAGVNATDTGYPGIYESYQLLEQKGVLIADWGGLVAGIYRKELEVPNSTFEYTKNTFVISKDGYHPSQFSGYITTLMTYCVITGERAVGQPYEFWNNANLSLNFDSKKYINKYYTKGTTNYPEIFASESEMRAIQELVDWYIENKPYVTQND